MPAADALHSGFDASTDAQPFIDSLGAFGTVLAIKLYRMQLQRPPGVPVLPCLDHEAMLHDGIAPHTAAYVQDAGGCLHEAVFIPASHRLDVEVASTVGECTPDSQAHFMAELQRRYPRCSVRLAHPSRLRGEPPDGVNDVHTHPISPRSFHVLLAARY